MVTVLYFCNSISQKENFLCKKPIRFSGLRVAVLGREGGGQKEHIYCTRDSCFPAAHCIVGGLLCNSITYLPYFITPDGENTTIFGEGKNISCLFVLNIKKYFMTIFPAYFLLLWGTL